MAHPRPRRPGAGAAPLTWRWTTSWRPPPGTLAQAALQPSRTGIFGAVAHELAQVNIARLRAPLESAELADFVAALDPVNASADRAPGFVWRLQTEDGNATAVRAFEWDAAGSAGVIVNLSVWKSVEELATWVYGPMHRQVLRRRREWFHRVTEATVALWWVPAGHRPTTDEAEKRVRRLRERGSTPVAFSFGHAFPEPGRGDRESVTGRPDWLCPA